MIRSLCISFFALQLAATAMWTHAAETKKAVDKKLQVVILTGGHPFNQTEFGKVFQGHDDLVCTHHSQKAGGEIFDDISRWPYDVIVLYNFNQRITPKEQENFLKLLDKGVGLVILHHANAAYNNWPLYREIAGVEYHFRPWRHDGKTLPASGYKGAVHFKVHVADADHPITHGLKDYDFVDETYCRTSVIPGVHVLLTTDEPSSDKNLSWTHTFRQARVFFLQSGHGETAYQNPIYRTLVTRGIRWTAGKI
jgi:uncharacterized protein